MRYVDMPISPLNQRVVVADEISFGATTGIVNGRRAAVVLLHITTAEGFDCTPIALCVSPEDPGDLGRTFTRVSQEAIRQLSARGME